MRDVGAFVRWGVVVVLAVLAVLYLNSAAYSVWAGSGPPTGHPHVWLYRAARHFGYAVAAFGVAAIVAFFLGRPATRAKVILRIGLIGLVVAGLAGPWAIHTVNVEACLHSGGHWDAAREQCHNEGQPSNNRSRGP